MHALHPCRHVPRTCILGSMPLLLIAPPCRQVVRKAVVEAVVKAVVEAVAKNAVEAVLEAALEAVVKTAVEAVMKTVVEAVVECCMVVQLPTP